MSDYPINTVICGDALEELRKLPSAIADLVLTDPPYNLSQFSTGTIKRKQADVGLDEKWDYGFDPTEPIAEMARILKPEGNLFVFALHNMCGKYHELLSKYFQIQSWMIWHKTNPTPQFRKVGFLKSCELVQTGWNKGHIWNFKTQKEMHNFFESPICMGSERTSHPTQKRLDLIEHIIEIASNQGGLVIDPYLGSGTTCVGAKRLARKYLGIEINPDYVEISRQRLARTEKPLTHWIGGE